MAEQPSNKVERGRFTVVNNTDKKPMEDAQYWALIVDDADGSNERCLLLTDTEIARLSLLSICELINEMKPGRLYRVGSHNSCLVKLLFDDREEVARITPALLKRAEERANSNIVDNLQNILFE